MCVRIDANVTPRSAAGVRNTCRVAYLAPHRCREDRDGAFPSPAAVPVIRRLLAPPAGVWHHTGASCMKITVTFLANLSRHPSRSAAFPCGHLSCGNAASSGTPDRRPGHIDLQQQAITTLLLFALQRSEMVERLISNPCVCTTQSFDVESWRVLGSLSNPRARDQPS